MSTLRLETELQAEPLQTGTLKTTGQSYHIYNLGKDHIPQVKLLHDFTIAGLNQHEESFVLEKPLSYFEEHFARDNIILGIIVEGQLIGEALILHPSQDHPKTGMVDMAPIASPETVSVMQSVCILPEYRGNALMEEMVSLWVAFEQASMTKAHQTAHLLAEVDIRNIASWNSFLKNGLNISGIGVDPDDGTLVYNIHAPVATITDEVLAEREALSCKDFFNQAAGDGIDLCSAGDLDKQQGLFSDGYQSIGYHRDMQSLVFQKTLTL